MVKSLEDTNLETRAARGRLAPRHKPYWHALDQGCQLGYYKGKDLGIWIARIPLGKGRFAEHRLGLADDFADADGIAVLDYRQAEAAARNWAAELAIKEAALPIDDSPFTIVGSPCNRR